MVHDLSVYLGDDLQKGCTKVGWGAKLIDFSPYLGQNLWSCEHPMFSVIVGTTDGQLFLYSFIETERNKQGFDISWVFSHMI